MIGTVPKEIAVYKTKTFARFARKAHITDSELGRAALRIAGGEIDADLGGGVIKQRIARAGEGKSGGHRAIILFRLQERVVFVYGFEKKNLGNIDKSELEAFRELAKLILGYSNSEMKKRVTDGALVKIQLPTEQVNAEKIS